MKADFCFMQSPKTVRAPRATAPDSKIYLSDHGESRRRTGIHFFGSRFPDSNISVPFLSFVVKKIVSARAPKCGRRNDRSPIRDVCAICGLNRSFGV
jgi:hypothetical protein